MTEAPAAVQKHPVGSRVAKGQIKPHVGPDRKAYEEAYKESVGEKSDEWWANVSRFPFASYFFCFVRGRR